MGDSEARREQSTASDHGMAWNLGDTLSLGAEYGIRPQVDMEPG